MKRKLIENDDIVATYMNTETGEIDYILTEGDTIKITTKEQKEYMSNQRKIKEHNSYVKVYQDVIEILAKHNLTKNDYKIILISLAYLDMSSGILSENGVNLNKKRFMEITNLSHNTFTESINRLIKIQVMARRKIGRNSVYLLNPFIFLNGKVINDTLYKIFKNSKWNTEDD